MPGRPSPLHGTRNGYMKHQRYHRKVVNGEITADEVPETWGWPACDACQAANTDYKRISDAIRTIPLRDWAPANA